MKIQLVGMNHKTAPVELRERINLGCSTGDQPSLIRELVYLPGVKEGIYIATCNRVEALIAPEVSDNAVEAVIMFFAEKFEIKMEELSRFLYIYNDADAVRHIFRVAASLDSMVLGEPQILGQVKDSYRLAAGLRSTGVILNRLLHRSFFVAKRVRTETRLGNSAVSISYAAVELAKKIFDDLSSKKVMLIGAGEMAELAVRHLVTNGVKDIVVINRTLERAVELARNLKAKAASFEEIESYLKVADIIISSTGAQGYVVHLDQVKRNLRKRRNRPLFLIDIAVPRDIDPEIDGLRNTYVYNIDELQSIVNGNIEDRKSEADSAERIVEEETIKFLKWIEGLDVVPTIVELQKKSELIRQVEIKKTLSNVKDFNEEHLEAIDILTRSILKKVLHDPIQFLKKERTHKEGKEKDIDYTRKIFDLNHDF